MGKKVIFLVLTISILSFCQVSKKELDEKYKEGLRAYYSKDYSKAISIFNEIKGIDPTYRTSQINNFIRRAETKLGKLGEKTIFKEGEENKREITVAKEGELEKLALDSQKVLLDCFEYFRQMERKYEIKEFDMLEPESTLKMAKKAYDEKQYTEAIRLANKARFQLDQIIQRKIEKYTPELGKIGETPVTLELMDADLEQTLKLIYDLTGANIIMSKGITGRVTINVKDLPLKKVLDLICEANKLKYIYQEGVIKIMTEEEYNEKFSKLRQLKKVFKILYGDGDAIAKALRETFRLETIIYDPRTNSIIVDVENPQILNNISEVISTLDTPVSQVILEAKIVEVISSGENLFSIDWLISSRMIDAIDGTLTGPRFGMDPAFTPGISSTLPSGFSFGITNKDVNTLIQALASRGKVKLLQSPKITCLNGTTALISVTQNYPYIIPEYEETYNPQTGARTGTRQTVTVYEEIVGTEFEVTPIIQRNRSVFLNLNIYDARFIETRTLSAIAAGLSYQAEMPIISTRETTQSVILYDNQTLVIGGMIQSREEVSETGVPFLRRIPLLGYLFKKPKHSTVNSELLLFLTPKVITTFEEAKEASKEDIKKSEEKIEPGILKNF